MNSFLKRRLCLIWLVAGCCLILWKAAWCDEGQRDTVILSQSPFLISVPVQFLEHAPMIDGVLDNDLSNLSIRGFTRMIRNESVGPIPEATYRLAYGTDFFYVLVPGRTSDPTGNLLSRRAI